VKSLVQSAHFATALRRKISKAVWRSEFFYFCNRVFRGGRRKSLQCNGLQVGECARSSFFDAKSATPERKPREFEGSARDFCRPDCKKQYKKRPTVEVREARTRGAKPERLSRPPWSYQCD
jgi:hypothetical protein